MMPILEQEYVTSFRAMGCHATIRLHTKDDGVALLRQAAERIAEIEAALSRFRPDSELSYVNAHSGQWTMVSRTLLQAALVSKQAARLTDGLCNPLVLPALIAAGYNRSFDQIDGQMMISEPPSIPDWQSLEIDTRRQRIRIPSGAGLDFGGVAKSWTAQQIAEQLAAYGPCLVNLGGDIVTRGRDWTVEIGEPNQDEANILSVNVHDAAVATSGTDYRRWQTSQGTQHHLIDPRTGSPAVSDVISVSVIHPVAFLAEAYAKAVLLMGSESGLAWLDAQWYGAALIVRSDGAVHSTRNFMSYVLQGETQCSAISLSY